LTKGENAKSPAQGKGGKKKGFGDFIKGTIGEIGDIFNNPNIDNEA
jgi:hypothetical protein